MIQVQGSPADVLELFSLTSQRKSGTGLIMEDKPRSIHTGSRQDMADRTRDGKGKTTVGKDILFPPKFLR
jgi:hypothetical protein